MKILNWLTAVFLTISLISCKKESANIFSLDTASGIWAGKYNYGSGDGNPFSLTLDKSGNSIFVDSSAGNTMYTGVYTVYGDSLSTFVSQSSTVLNIKLKVNNDLNYLEGIWTNPSGGASGQFKCTKK